MLMRTKADESRIQIRFVAVAIPNDASSNIDKSNLI